MNSTRRIVLMLGFLVLGLLGWATQQHAQGAHPSANRGPAGRFANGRPDSALVWGPNTYTSTSATGWTYAAVTVTIPGFDASKRYFVRIANGDTASGTNRVTQASMTIGGKEFLSPSDISSSVSALNKVIWLTQAQSTFQFGVSGPVGRYIRARIYETPDPSYDLAVTSGELTIPFGLNVTSDGFSKPANASGPWTVRVVNGDGYGTGACTNLKVTLNGVDVVPLGLVNAANLTVVRQVTLLTSNTVSLRLYGESGFATLHWTASDTSAPVVTVVRPTEAMVTDSASVATTATVTDQSVPTSVHVDGISGTITSYSGFTVATPLPTEGLYSLNISATDRAGYTKSVVRHVIRDNTAPVLTVNRPTPASMSTDSVSITVGGLWSDTSMTTVSVDGTVVGIDSSGAFSFSVPLDIGSNGILFRARDAMGHETSFKRFVYRNPVETVTPRDATAFANSASTLSAVELTPFATSVAFIYTGANPVQTGLQGAPIQAGQEAVIHGRVLARDLNPLPNVTVRVLDHPEYGQTLTRTDGQFDLVVNAGGRLALRFLKEGFLEAQRQVSPRVQDYAVVEDVSLVGKSSRTFLVDTSSPSPVVSRFENDLNGDRKTTMIFAPATICSVTAVNGAATTFTAFHVRAKEFTVGSSGDDAMPAALPPSTAYAYCAELSVDEATAQVANPGDPEPRVSFSKPVSLYVKDMLGLGVGHSVPLGFYEKSSGKWVPGDDGCVVAVLSTSGLLATLDTDLTPGADTQSRYDALGITDDERTQIKLVFAPGDTLMRSQLWHFSTPDMNPNAASIERASFDVAAALFAWLRSIIDKFLSNSCSCIIENENRVLGQSIPVVGTPFTLNYRSSRQFGDLAMRTVRVPLTGSVAPPGLTGIQVIVEVAGRRYTYRETSPMKLTSPNQTWLFDLWDGKDVFGRPVLGSVTATVRYGFEFQAKYIVASGSGSSYGNGKAAGAGGGILAPGDRSVGRIIWQTQTVSIGAPSMASAGLGGWTISPHHFYDTNGQGTLYLGDGTYVAGTQQFPTRSMFAGQGAMSGAIAIPADGSVVTGGAAGAVTPNDIAFAPNGDLYLTDGSTNARLVARVTPDGRYFRVAGRGAAPYSTDGVLATSVLLENPLAIEVSADGSVYFIETGSTNGARVFRITAGKLYLVAGQPTGTFAEGMLAADAPLVSPLGLAIGSDGAVFIADDRRIIRVGTDGRATTYGGNGTSATANSGEGFLGRADSLGVQSPGEMVVDANGNLLVLEGSGRILKISPDNRMSAQVLKTRDNTILSSVNSLARGPDGSIYVSQNFGNAASSLNSRMSVFRYEADGGLTIVAGGLPSAPDFRGQEGVFATATRFGLIASIAVDRYGVLYIGEKAAANNANGITRYAPELSSPQLGLLTVPSADGSQKYVFNANGRHLRTVDATTSVVLYEFTYDSVSGALEGIRDADGLLTTISRVGNTITIHAPAPFDQTTTLQLDGSGKYLTSVANPKSETYQMSYISGGLLETFTTPRGKVWRYIYDPTDGRLESEQAPGAPSNKKLTFALEESGTNRKVTKTSPEGRVTKYTIMRLLDGIRRHVLLRPDGVRETSVDSMSVENSVANPAGEVERTVGASGETRVTRTARDPRFGWLSRVDSTVVTKLPISSTTQVVSQW